MRASHGEILRMLVPVDVFLKPIGMGYPTKKDQALMRNVKDQKRFILHPRSAAVVHLANPMGNGVLRLQIMAHVIRHEQQGEIALMNGVHGFPAVQQALRNMLADKNK
jgi:hypothetical protein